MSPKHSMETEALSGHPVVDDEFRHDVDDKRGEKFSADGDTVSGMSLSFDHGNPGNPAEQGLRSDDISELGETSASAGIATSGSPTTSISMPSQIAYYHQPMEQKLNPKPQLHLHKRSISDQDTWISAMTTEEEDEMEEQPESQPQTQLEFTGIIAAKMFSETNTGSTDFGPFTSGTTINCCQENHDSLSAMTPHPFAPPAVSHQNQHCPPSHNNGGNLLSSQDQRIPHDQPHQVTNIIAILNSRDDDAASTSSLSTMTNTHVSVQLAYHNNSNGHNSRRQPTQDPPDFSTIVAETAGDDVSAMTVHSMAAAASRHGSIATASHQPVVQGVQHYRYHQTDALEVTSVVAGAACDVSVMTGNSIDASQYQDDASIASHQPVVHGVPQSRLVHPQDGDLDVTSVVAGDGDDEDAGFGDSVSAMTYLSDTGVSKSHDSQFSSADISNQPAFHGSYYLRNWRDCPGLTTVVAGTSDDGDCCSVSTMSHNTGTVITNKSRVSHSSAISNRPVHASESYRHRTKQDSPDFTSIVAGPGGHNDDDDDGVDSGDTVSTMTATAAPFSTTYTATGSDDSDKATVHDMSKSKSPPSSYGRRRQQPGFTSILGDTGDQTGDDDGDSGDSVSTMTATAAPYPSSIVNTATGSDDSNQATIHDMEESKSRTTVGRRKQHESPDFTSIKARDQGGCDDGDSGDSVSTMTTAISSSHFASDLSMRPAHAPRVAYRVDSPDFSSILAAEQRGQQEDVDSGGSVSTMTTAVTNTYFDSNLSTTPAHLPAEFDEEEKQNWPDVTSIVARSGDEEPLETSDSVSTMTTMDTTNYFNSNTSTRAIASGHHAEQEHVRSTRHFPSFTTVLGMEDADSLSTLNTGASANHRECSDDSSSIQPAHYLRAMPELDAATLSGILVGPTQNHHPVAVGCDVSTLAFSCAMRPSLAGQRAHSLTSIFCENNNDDVSAMTPPLVNSSYGAIDGIVGITNSPHAPSHVAWDQNAYDEVSAISGTGDALVYASTGGLEVPVPNSIVAGCDIPCDVSAMTGEMSFRPDQVVYSGEHPHSVSTVSLNSVMEGASAAIHSDATGLTAMTPGPLPPLETISMEQVVHGSSPASVSTLGMSSVRGKASARIRKRSRYLNTRLTRPKSYLQSILEGDEAPASFIPREQTNQSIDEQVDYLERNVKTLEAMHQHATGKPRLAVHRALLADRSDASKSSSSSASSVNGGSHGISVSANGSRKYAGSTGASSKSRPDFEGAPNNTKHNASASAGSSKAKRGLSVTGLLRSFRSLSTSNGKTKAPVPKKFSVSSSSNKYPTKTTSSNVNIERQVGDLEEMYVLSRQFEEKAHILAIERKRRERHAQRKRITSPMLVSVMGLKNSDAISPTMDEVAYLDPITVMRQQHTLQVLLDEYRKNP